ncbi:MAG: hypothetical protein ABWZ82_05405 [Candidatus Limnocylindrales bacterium]
MSRDPRPTDDREIPPADLRMLARARSQARREHRFDEADRIRAEIEAQGWKVVDRGAEARLVRAHPHDVVEADGVTRYGWTGAVPSDGGAEGVPAADPTAITVVVRALPKVEATDSLVARLTGGGTRPRHVLVVAGEDRPDPTLDGTDVIRMRGEVRPGTLLAVALRRVADGVVVVGERWPADATPDDIDALAARLGDPEVAVAGLDGLRSDDLRRFRAGSGADTPVEAVGWAGLAFRAVDARARGEVDEGFNDADLLAAWWSLVLRDDPDSAAPRRALALRASEAAPDDALRDDRATRRDRYRLIDSFAGRDDLLVGGGHGA